MRWWWLRCFWQKLYIWICAHMDHARFELFFSCFHFIPLIPMGTLLVIPAMTKVACVFHVDLQFTAFMASNFACGYAYSISLKSCVKIIWKCTVSYLLTVWIVWSPTVVLVLVFLKIKCFTAAPPLAFYAHFLSDLWLSSLCSNSC